ncbi:uncharacterized protein PHALS_02359 [Plasmopara halstedii]|uniref:Uncharacterized protein n=1 Tax=Plasmopara halstedii TaxID=4781 RepID=A0A0P1AX05_PLAHL|nr:uncharacterized protein PHALS_02359 [Plasmopara halstedii]CEG46032.1 hypothetical protein PHALS_02359 [Plasmopara halstedii]|eukprot:XP_024582401.1 hypothetical protein PHALS_02359 [Plasmopara halstedii]
MANLLMDQHGGLTASMVATCSLWATNTVKWVTHLIVDLLLHGERHLVGPTTMRSNIALFSFKSALSSTRPIDNSLVARQGHECCRAVRGPLMAAFYATSAGADRRSTRTATNPAVWGQDCHQLSVEFVPGVLKRRAISDCVNDLLNRQVVKNECLGPVTTCGQLQK